MPSWKALVATDSAVTMDKIPFVGVSCDGIDPMVREGS